MNDTGNVKGSSMAEQTSPLRNRIAQRENVRQPFTPARSAQSKALVSLNDLAGAWPTSLSSGSSMAFGEILSAFSKRRLETPRAGTPETRPIGQTSGLQRSLDTVSQAISPALNAVSAQAALAIEGVPFASLISAAAAKYGVRPDLVAAVVKAESSFSPKAQSGAGAKGLMQLMDGTARSLGVTNAFDPEQNIEGGVKFLSSLLKRFDGDSQLALAAYNAGPGAVDKYGGVPPYQETKNYISTVMKYWNDFQKSVVVRSPEPGAQGAGNR